MFAEDLLSQRRDAALERETQRQKRIFNDKCRTIGLDLEGLDAQVKEKEKREAAEQAEQCSYDTDMIRGNKAAQILHLREVKQRRAIDKADVEYRRQHQQPPCPREFDVKNPYRYGKPDFLDLLGEDQNNVKRQRRQKEQLREWLLQQQRERAAERQQQKLEEQCYDQNNAELHNKALQLQALEMEQRRAVAIATKEYNPAKLNMQCEEPEPAPTVLGVHGSRPSSDRNIPPESIQEIIQFQKCQIEEKKKAELERKRDDDEFDRICLDSNRRALLIERQQAKLNKQLRRQMDNTNGLMAEMQKEKPDIACSDDGFFSKFNTCSR